jgi:hypothetical protein
VEIQAPVPGLNEPDPERAEFQAVNSSKDEVGASQDIRGGLIMEIEDVIPQQCTILGPTCYQVPPLGDRCEESGTDSLLEVQLFAAASHRRESDRTESDDSQRIDSGATGAMAILETSDIVAMGDNN